MGDKRFEPMKGMMSLFLTNHVFACSQSWTCTSYSPHPVVRRSFALYLGTQATVIKKRIASECRVYYLCYEMKIVTTDSYILHLVRK